jgi:hypothetical protein
MTVDLRRRRRYRCAMRRCVVLVMVALGIAGCGSTHTMRHVAPGPRLVAGGCGATPLHRGVLPAWARPAYNAGGAGAPPWPYAVAEKGTAVGIVFGYPLRAGKPTDPANKVLWIMRRPRHGLPLSVTARPAAGGGPVVRGSWSADSGPGEIYPSYVNVPRAGCWHVTLRWAHHTDAIDLRYVV